MVNKVQPRFRQRRTAYDEEARIRNRLVQLDQSLDDIEAQLPETNDLTAAVVWANIPDANVPESAVTQHEAAIDHDALTNFETDEHIDWVVTGAEDIHDDRIAESSVTQHEAALKPANMDSESSTDGQVLTSTGSGGIAWEKTARIVSTLTATTLTIDNEDVVLVDDDTAGSAVTVTLPTAVGISGRWIDIKKLGTTAVVTVDADGTETIDGSLTAVILVQYESITLLSDGANWNII